MSLGIRFHSVRLRKALLFIFLGTTLFTGLMITFMALGTELEMGEHFAREVGQQMSNSLVGQVEYSIEETEEFVKIAKLFMERNLKDEKFHQRMIRFYGDFLGQNPSLGSVAYRDVETGYGMMVHPPRDFVNKKDSRPGSGGSDSLMDYESQIIVEELIPIPGNSKSFLLKSYKLNDYPTKVTSTTELSGFDFRNRPWFLAATNNPDKNGISWTKTYAFAMRHNQKNSNGLTCAAQINDTMGQTVGVIGIDISTNWLSDLLEDCVSKLSRKGLSAFIIEDNEDGTYQMIAHSEKGDIFPTGSTGNIQFLSKPEELKSPVVKDMLTSIPANLKPNRAVLLNFVSQGKDYVGLARDITPGRPPSWTSCLYVSKEDLYYRAYSSFRRNIIYTFLVMLASGLMSLYLAGKTSKPLEGLALAANQIGKLDFKTMVNQESWVHEVRELALSLHQMKIGLQSFTRYLPRDLLVALFKSGLGAQPGGTEKLITISFSDVVDFTHYSEQMPPNDLVEQLNEYLGCFSTVITENEGTVDKFIGDAVMAYWNAPNPCEDHAFKACKAAIHGLERLALLQKNWAQLGKPIFRARVGINTGSAIIGNIGTEEHLNYTVVGDNVNLASRLEGLNRTYGTKVLITESTLHLVSDRVVSRPVDLVAVKGKGIRVMVHELIGLKGETSPEEVQACEEFARAHALYRTRNWEQALPMFQELARGFAEDPLPGIFVKRCEEFMAHPPVENWDGSQEMHSK